MHFASLVETPAKSLDKEYDIERSRIGAMSAVTTGMTKTKETMFISSGEVGNSRLGPKRTKALAINISLSSPESRLESGGQGLDWPLEVGRR